MAESTPPGSTPVPDPTALTTENLRREILGLRELLETRLEALERAGERFQEQMLRVPTETDRRVMDLKTLHDERFASVHLQFRERDDRNRALADAAAEAIKKTETATGKQIDSILAVLAASSRALEDKLASMVSRLDRQEGSGGGQLQLWGLIVGGIGMFSVLLAIFIALRTLLPVAPTVQVQVPTTEAAPSVPRR